MNYYPPAHPSSHPVLAVVGAALQSVLPPEHADNALWAEVEQMIGENRHLVEGLAAVLFVNPFLEGSEAYEIFERIEARRAALDAASA